MHAPCDNHYEVSSCLKGHQNAQTCVKCEVMWKQHFLMLIHKEHWISLTCISRHKWRGPQCTGAFVIPFRVLNVLCMNSYLVTLRGEKFQAMPAKRGSWYFFGILFKISAQHPHPFYAAHPGTWVTPKSTCLHLVLNIGNGIVTWCYMFKTSAVSSFYCGLSHGRGAPI